MFEVNKCPLCSKKLEFKQINMNMAVEICVDLNCKYPVGGKCRIIVRKLEDSEEFTESLRGIETDSRIASQKMQFHNSQKASAPPVEPQVSTAQQNSFNEDLDTLFSNLFENTVQSTIMQPETNFTMDPLNLSSVSTQVLDDLFEEFDLNFN